MATTDRNGETLKKGDLVTMEMVVSDVFINASADREVVLTADSPGAPPLTVYCAAVHLTKKEDQTPQGAATAPVTSKVPAGSTVNPDGSVPYPDGSVHEANGTLRTPAP